MRGLLRILPSDLRQGVDVRVKVLAADIQARAARRAGTKRAVRKRRLQITQGNAAQLRHLRHGQLEALNPSSMSFSASGVTRVVVVVMVWAMMALLS